MQYRRCSIENCIAYANSKGLCNRHQPKSECVIVGCTKRGTRKGNCESHYTKCFLYGLTSDQLSELLIRTECDACGKTGKLHIDHDHLCCPKLPACGECVRGVLCSGCNKALGFVNDDPRVLAALMRYLR